SHLMTTNKAFLLPVVVDDTREDDENVRTGGSGRVDSWPDASGSEDNAQVDWRCVARKARAAGDAWCAVLRGAGLSRPLQVLGLQAPGVATDYTGCSG